MTMYLIRKNRLIRYGMLTFISLVISFLYFEFNKSLPTIVWLTDVSGYIGLVALAISLLIGPLNVLMRQKNPVSTYLRRDIGIFGGLLASIHTGTGLFVHLKGRPWLYFLIAEDHAWKIRFDKFGYANDAGLIASLIILLLLVISNDYSLKLLKTRIWKNLQRFSYVMFIFVISHSILYRSNANNKTLIYGLYIPLFIIILIFQLSGIWIKKRHYSLKAIQRPESFGREKNS